MSLRATSTGHRVARAATAIAVAVAVLAPLAVLCAQLWSDTGRSRAFVGDERRGVAYLAPLTRLLAATTAAQSAAVRGQPVRGDEVEAAVAEVDRTDARLGGALRTSDRWAAARATARQRIARSSWPEPSVAYTQYSDLNVALLELSRTVGDNSRLILDPAIDSYYVMNASLLRIPEILVDSGRYADLSVLSAAGSATDTADAGDAAQLAVARNRVATDAADLADGLVKAFAQTGSPTLGPGMTRQLDDFRTAVDAVAPSTSLLAPAPQRSLSDLASDQLTLQRTALALQDASLGQLDLLLADRAGAATRTRLVALAAVVLGLLVAAGLAVLVVRRLPAPAGPSRHARPEPVPEPERRPATGARPVRVERSGGARAAG